MGFGKIGPGDDVEAWCTRCRMTLNHRIIAMVGSTIQRVQCLTCNGEHKYHLPKDQKTGGTGRKSVRVSPGEKLSRKPLSSVKPSPERAKNEWTTFMRELPEGYEPRSYKISESFKVGEFIQHPSLGMGRVLDIAGAEKIEVIFESGRKILLFNRKIT
jgi:hypothetical protein